jgi:hypothetical protein
LECDAPPIPVCGAPVGITPSDPVGDPEPAEPAEPAELPEPLAEPDPPVRLAAPAPPDDAPEAPPAPVVPPELVPPEALALPAAGVTPDPVVGVVVGDTAATLFMNVVVQVTVLPPPLEEPLH